MTYRSPNSERSYRYDAATRPHQAHGRRLAIEHVERRLLLSGTDLDASIFNLDSVQDGNYAVISFDAPGFTTTEPNAPDSPGPTSSIDGTGPGTTLPDADALSNLGSAGFAIPAPRPRIGKVGATQSFVAPVRSPSILDGIYDRVPSRPTDATQLFSGAPIEPRPGVLVDLIPDGSDNSLVVSGPQGNVLTIRPDEIQLTRAADPIVSDSDDFITLENPSRPGQSTTDVLIGQGGTVRSNDEGTADPISSMPEIDADTAGSPVDAPSSGNVAGQDYHDPAPSESSSAPVGSEDSEGGMIPIHIVVNAAREFAPTAEISEDAMASVGGAADEISMELQAAVTSDDLWGELTRAVAFEVIDSHGDDDARTESSDKQAASDALLDVAIADVSAGHRFVTQVIASSGAAGPLAALNHSRVLLGAMTPWLRSALVADPAVADWNADRVLPAAGALATDSESTEAARGEAFSHWCGAASDVRLSSLDALPFLGVLALERFVSARSRTDHDRGAAPPPFSKRRDSEAR